MGLCGSPRHRKNDGLRLLVVALAFSSGSVHIRTVNFGQVFVEAFGGLGDDLEMTDGQHGFVETVGLRIKFGEGDGGLEGIFDLTPVPGASFGFGETEVVLLGVFLDRFAVHFDVFLVLDQSLQVHFPDFAAGVLVKLRVVQADVDTGFEGFVEMTNFVGGKKEDSGVVFEYSQEDRDNAIASHVFFVACLEEDIGFVQKQYAAPSVRKTEVTLKVLFDLFGGFADVAAGDRK